MTRAAAPLLAAVLVLAGCATARPGPTGSPTERAAAGFARVLPLVETATVSSLTEASRALGSGGSGDAGRAPGAPALTAAAGRVFAFLYPELPSPFAGSSAAPADSPSGLSPFLDKVLPAMDLLGSRSSFDETRAVALQSDIAAADVLNAGSVLPPWLQALLDAASGNRAAQRPRLEETLRRDPGFYPAARLLSELILAGDNAGAELPRLEQLAALLPTPAQRFAVLARARLAAGKAQGAADAAAQGLLAAPEDSSFALLRAQALEALGDWYQALRILDSVLKLEPDLVPAVVMKARLLHDDENSTVEAVRLLDEAEVRFPGEAALPELRGRILIDLGSTDAGMEELKRALAIEPRRVTALSLLLRETAAAGQWSDAVSWLEEIPEVARTANDLRAGWKAAEGLGRYDAAVEYARALGERGAATEAIALEARSLLAGGHAGEALAAADRGLAAVHTPEDRSVLLAIRAVSGSADPLADLRQALIDNPDNVEALIATADLLAAQGEVRRASEYARRAAELDPRNATLASRAADLAAQAASGK